MNNVTELINWHCPLCHNENTEEIECFVDKDRLIKNFNCKLCEEEVFASL